MPGWGTVAGWIFDRFPNKKESLRNQAENIKRELNEIQNRRPFRATDADKYQRLAHKLRQVEQKIKNI